MLFNWLNFCFSAFITVILIFIYFFFCDPIFQCLWSLYVCVCVCECMSIFTKQPPQRIKTYTRIQYWILITILRWCFFLLLLLLLQNRRRIYYSVVWCWLYSIINFAKFFSRFFHLMLMDFFCTDAGKQFSVFFLYFEIKFQYVDRISCLKLTKIIWFIKYFEIFVIFYMENFPKNLNSNLFFWQFVMLRGW